MENNAGHDSARRNGAAIPKAGSLLHAAPVVLKIYTRSLIELSPIDSIFANVGRFGKLIIRDCLINKSYGRSSMGWPGEKRWHGARTTRRWRKSPFEEALVRSPIGRKRSARSTTMSQPPKSRIAQCRAADDCRTKRKGLKGLGESRCDNVCYGNYGLLVAAD
jgi:hypothetical protein